MLVFALSICITPIDRTLLINGELDQHFKIAVLEELCPEKLIHLKALLVVHHITQQQFLIKKLHQFSAKPPNI